MNNKNNKINTPSRTVIFRKFLFTLMLALASAYLLSCQAINIVKPPDTTTVARSAISYDPTVLNIVTKAGEVYKGDPYRVTMRNSTGASVIVKSIEIVGENTEYFTLEKVRSSPCTVGVLLKNGSTCIVGVIVDGDTPSDLYEDVYVEVIFTKNVAGKTEDIVISVQLRANVFEGSDDFQILTYDNKSTLVLYENFGVIPIGDGKSNGKKYKIRNTTGGPRTLSFSSSSPEVFKVAEVAGEIAKDETFCKLLGQSLDDGEECIIGIRFYPRQVDPETSIITVKSSAGESAVALFKGQGATADPAPIETAVLKVDRNYIQYKYPVSIGSKSAEEFTVRVKNIAPSDNITLQFSVSHIETNVITLSGTCTTLTSLAPGEECTISFAFRPLEVKKYSDAITLSYSDGFKSYESVIVILCEGISPEKLKDINIGVAYSDTDAEPNDNEYMTLDEVTLPLTLTKLPVAKLSTDSIFIKLTNKSSSTILFSDAITGSSYNIYNISNIDDPRYCGGSIMAGESCVMKIKISPNTLGNNNAIYTVTSAGSAYAMSIVTEAVDSSQGTGIKLNKTDITMLDTQVDIVTTQNLIVSNTSATPQPLTFVFPNSRVIFDVTTTCRATLPAKNSCEVRMMFKPQKAQQYNTSFSINGMSVSIRGKGVSALEYDTITEIPSVEFSKKAHNFGSYAIGHKSPLFKIDVLSRVNKTFQVEQPRADFIYMKELSTCQIDSSNRFSLTIAPSSPTAACRLAYIFSPKLAGSIVGYLRLTDIESKKSSEVTLKGDGYALSKSANFGYQIWGRSKTADVVYANEGNAPIDITDIKISANEVEGNQTETAVKNADTMKIDVDSCKGKTILPGDTCKVTVKYTPYEIPGTPSKMFIGKLTFSVTSLTAGSFDDSFMLLGTTGTDMIVPVKPWSTVKPKSSIGESLVEYNGYVYALGGTRTPTIAADPHINENNILYRYDPNRNIWTELKPSNPENSPYAGYRRPWSSSVAPLPVYDGSIRDAYLGVYDGKLIVAGGSLANSLPYSTTVDVSKMPYGKINFISFYDDKDTSLSPDGAWVSHTKIEDIYKRGLAPTGSYLANSTVDRYLGSTTMLNSKIIVHGGAFTGNGGAGGPYFGSDSVSSFSYDVEENEKIARVLDPTFAFRILSSSTVQVDGLLYYFGGVYYVFPTLNNYTVATKTQQAFTLLKPGYDSGKYSYPFSTSVGVARHMGAIPPLSHSHSSATIQADGTGKKTEIMLVGGGMADGIYHATLVRSLPNNLKDTSVTATWTKTNTRYVQVKDYNNGTTRVFIYDNSFWIHSGEMIYAHFFN